MGMARNLKRLSLGRVRLTLIEDGARLAARVARYSLSELFHSLQPAGLAGAWRKIHEAT